MRPISHRGAIIFIALWLRCFRMRLGQKYEIFITGVFLWIHNSPKSTRKAIQKHNVMNSALLFHKQVQNKL